MSFDWRTATLALLVLPLVPISLALLQRSVERRATVFLCGWFLAWSLLTVPSIIGFAGAYQRFPWLTFAPFDTELWLGPLIYLYTLALTRAEWPTRWWLWLLPGIVQTIYYTLCFVALGDAEAKFAYASAFHGPFVIPVESVLSVVLALAGVALSFVEIARYRRWLASSHSAMRDFDLSALRGFLMIMVFLVALWTTVEVWQLAVHRFSYNSVAIVLMAAGAAIVWLAIDSLTQVRRAYPKMPPDAWVARLDPCPIEAPTETLQSLRARIREAGWHRDSGLTIKQLARHLATNESQLSATINAVDGMNFNLLINGLRLEQVCTELLNPSENRSLLDLALDVGFGSKATFNRTFKDQVGMTPSQWKRQGQTSQIPGLFEKTKS